MTSQESPEITRSNDAEPTARPTRKTVSDNQSERPPEEDGLDFVVTEAHSQDPELVGGFKTPKVDPLGVESTADLMESAARPGQTEDVATPQSSMLGETYPPYAPPEEDFSDVDTDGIGITDETVAPTRQENSFEKLSEQRINEISQRMKAETERQDYLSEEETQQIISRMNGENSPTKSGIGFDTQPIVPPKRSKEINPDLVEMDLSSERPKIAKRVRGIALFAKGYIHVSGEQELREGDEMSINGREYILRRKRFSNKIIAAIVTPLAAVLVFILGTQLTPDAQIGDGRIVGFALDRNNQPYVGGATIRFPETGMTFETNGQGFFRSEQLPAGSYKIEYLINNEVLAADYATVSDNHITTVVLKPEIAQPAASRISPTASAERTSGQSLAQVDASSAPPKPQATVPAQEARRTSRRESPAQYAKLTLAANVEGARLSIDGSVVGAGNLTYSKIKPGQHSYTVSKDGYTSVNGTVNLSANNTNSLKVTLQPTAVAPKPDRHPERDLYNTAETSLGRGDAQAAIADLTRAVELTPGYAEAYALRAEAYRLVPDKQSAFDDHLKAAEIYQSRSEYDKASSSYQEALKLNPKGIAAYLGRGSLYLARNESIAAVADFDQAVSLDKRNVDGYIGLGRARYNQGHFDKAAKHFRDARSLDSNNPIIHQYLMLSHFGAGEFDEVQKDYEKYLKCATEEQVRQLKADSRFGQVLRIVK